MLREPLPARQLTRDIWNSGPSGPGEAVVLDLDDIDWNSSTCATLVEGLRALVGVPLVGVSSRPLPPSSVPVVAALTTTFAPSGPAPYTVQADPEPLLRQIDTWPTAAAHLAGLLRLTSESSVDNGLIAESFAYSLLLTGSEFSAWRARTPRRPVAVEDEPPVLVERRPHELAVRLNRPKRRNAYSAAMRDGLLDALTVAWLDPDVGHVSVRGAGRAFCAGGDLDEFGTAPDLAEAHNLRLATSTGRLVHRLGDRVRFHLHGACIGAGIEIPAFASFVSATRDAWFQLPELAMGLVPGAGGTVSITHRIGRWRTAYLALSGERVDASTALRWGLIDEIDD